MINKEKISAFQFRTLVIFFTIGTTIINVPSYMAVEAKQDAWIGAALGVALGLIIIWLYTKLGLLFPRMTFVEMNRALFGQWIGNTLSLFFLLLPFLYGSELLYYLGSFMSIEIFPETPVAAIHFLMVVIVIMGVRLGLETIIRSSEIFIVFFFILFIILVAFITPQIKLENLQPVFEADVKSLLRGAFIFIDFSTATAVILLMIFPASVNQPKAAAKSFIVGYLIGGFVMIVIIFLNISVLGVDNTARHLYPTYILAREINIGHFIQRMEAVLAIMWILSIYVKMSMYLYVVALGIGQILNLKDHRPLVLPLGGISLALSLVMFSNIIEQQNWDKEISIFFSYTVGLLLPLIIFCIVMLRKMVQKRKNKTNSL